MTFAGGDVLAVIPAGPSTARGDSVAFTAGKLLSAAFLAGAALLDAGLFGAALGAVAFLTALDLPVALPGGAWAARQRLSQEFPST